MYTRSTFLLEPDALSLPIDKPFAVVVIDVVDGGQVGRTVEPGSSVWLKSPIAGWTGSAMAPTRRPGEVCTLRFAEILNAREIPSRSCARDHVHGFLLTQAFAVKMVVFPLVLDKHKPFSFGDYGADKRLMQWR
jgi:hypothetical protein